MDWPLCWSCRSPAASLIRGNLLRSSRVFFPSRTRLELTLLHVHLPPTKSDPLGLQTKTLLERRVPSELDLTPSAQYALPWQAESSSQNSGDQARRARIASHFGHSAVSGHLASRDRSNRTLDSDAHHASRIWVRFRLRHRSSFAGRRRFRRPGPPSGSGLLKGKNIAVRIARTTSSGVNRPNGLLYAALR
jgi:hypothetical protein